MKIAITGANSSVGLNLLTRIDTREQVKAVAVVRSQKAAEAIPESAAVKVFVTPYDDINGMAQALVGIDCIVHLAGILIETAQSSYQSANVDATAAVIAAAQSAGVAHLVLISVIGASPDSRNPYFRSKGQAETLVQQSGLSTTILRTPILLGRDTAGAKSLLAMSRRDKVGILGGGHYRMRPLDVDDLSSAILQCCATQTEGSISYDLAGPEEIAYRDLVARLAHMQGRAVIVTEVPIWIAKLGAAVKSRLRAGGITPAVIDVITQDEKVLHNADVALGLTLTSLDTTLAKILID